MKVEKINQDDNFTTFRYTQRYGMEGVGDMALEWLTDKEREEQWKQYSNWVEECKTNGTYGQEYTQTIKIEHDPMFEDNKKQQITTKQSHSMIMWDINKK